VAALALGVLGGLAADPEMKPVAENDWRERYRGRAAAPAPAPDYGYGYGWGYGLIGPRAAEFVSAVRYPWEEEGPAADEWLAETEPAPPEVPLDADAMLERSPGAAAVADALARTEGIGAETAPGEPLLAEPGTDDADTAIAQPLPELPAGPDGVPSVRVPIVAAP